MRSIRTKLVASVVVGGLLVLAVPITVAVHSARTTAAERSQREAARLVQRHAEAAEAELAPYRTLTVGLAESFQGYAEYVTNRWPFQKRFDATVMLREVASAHPEIRRLALAFESDAFDGRDWRYKNDDAFHDATGRFIPSWVRGPDGTLAAAPAQGYGSSDWYRVPRETEEPYVSELVVSGGMPTITFSAPVLDEDGTFLGVVSADVAVDDLLEEVVAAEVSETSHTFVVSRSGAVMAHPNEVAMGKAMPSDYGIEPGEVFTEAATGEGKPLEITDPRTGQEAFLVSAPLPTMGAVVVAVVPKAEVMAPVRSMMWNLLAGGLLALALIASAAFFLAGRIVRPIHQLKNATRRIAAGDTSVRTDVARRDELGELAEGFDAMVQYFESSLGEAEAGCREAEAAGAEADEARATAEAQVQYLAGAVGRLQHTMERFAGGDLSVALPAESDDSVARLYDSVNRALANVRTVLREVAATAGRSTETSADVSASVQQLTTVTQEQSAQASEVAAAVEEMGRAITANAQTASQAAEAAQSHGAAAREGRAVVAETTTKVQQIAEVVIRSAETVERLGASSREIGAIVETIEDIADQTNLLALNAAIEAARAGEHGRGFAVVADEVRKLAERTTHATAEIARMIQTIQGETTEAVEAMHRGEQEVEAGIALADQTRQALEQIVAGFAETEALVSEIAAAGEEQSSAGAQIARSVEGIAAAAGEASRGVEQIASATDEQRRLNESLAHFVTRFRLSDTGVAQPVLSRGDGSGRPAPQPVPAR